MEKYRWRVTLIGKTPARELGTFVAPTEQEAIEKVFEFYDDIPEVERFRVAARCIGRAARADLRVSAR